MKYFYLLILILLSVSIQAQVPSTILLLDNFNRNDSVKVGVPAGSTFEYWREYGELSFPTGCNGPSAIRLKNNLMEMSRYDWFGTACVSNTAKAANIETTFKYPTVFSTAPGVMEWYFNMQQSLADPTGFNPGQDGVSFVVGSSTSDPAGSPRGYAVVFGDGTTDRIRLISFLSGFTNGTFTEMVSVPPPSNKATYMSVRVTYNPCNNEWSLRVRDDGSAFADPTTITGAPTALEKVVNSTHTSQNLPFIGGIWNHSTSSAIARFDNVYIPNGNTIGSYVWNGSTSTDFQTASNWTPARNCISAGDRLLFNALSPVNSVLTNVPGQALRQLWITTNRHVTMKDVANGAVSVIGLTGGAAGAALWIETGSSLTLDVTGTNLDGFNINLGTGATASISGSLIFDNTIGSGVNPHRLIANMAGAVTINAGGLVNAVKLDGNPFGNSGTPNVYIFNSGAVYESRSGSDPFALPVPSSRVLFNRGSVYRHFNTSEPSLAGRTYANFEMHGTANGITGSNMYAFTADTVKIFGTLQLTGSSNGEALNTAVKGDLIVYPGASFDYDPVIASSITFNSNFATQKINNTGNMHLGRNLTVRLNSAYSVPQLTVENDVSINGTLQLSSGTIHLEGNITMRSDSIHTAAVAPVTGSISYGTGRFVIERFIPAHKAWQFLAVPTTVGQTIKNAWQEDNIPLANLTPGYGTIITSNIAGNGFDILTPAGPSMKTYNSSNNTWVGIPNTDTDPIANKKGYMLLVRGDRSVTTYNAAPVPVILRTTGKIFAPGIHAPPYTTIVSGKFESIGNPYASAIDFNLVTRTGGVQNNFYVWDPKLTGGSSAFGLGGIQSFVFNGTTYDVIPGGGSYTGSNRYIESGQAFFARCTTPNGNVTFTEACKVTASSLVTRGGPVTSQQLRTNLYVVINNKPVLLDGVMSLFHDEHKNDIDREDGFKMSTTGESIAIIRDGTELVADRSVFAYTDTIFYKLDRLLKRQYQLQVVTTGFKIPGARLFLVDQWQGTKKKIEGADTSFIDFTVGADPLSAASNRFFLVFDKKQDNLPGNEGFISIHPNPVTGKKMVIEFSGKAPGDYSVELINTSGQVVFKTFIQLTGSATMETFSLKNNISGYHQLRISGAGTTTTRKIIVR